MTTPHLLGIPPELRCLIYDYLFSQAVARPGAEGPAYRLPNEWPETDIADFVSISVACRQLRQETIPYFEKFHLPGAKLYFDKGPSLYRASRAIEFLAPRNPEYNNIAYSMRSYPTVLMPTPEKFDPIMLRWIDYSELVCLATENLHTYDIVTPGVGTHVCRNCHSRLTIFNQAFPQFDDDEPAPAEGECLEGVLKDSPIATRSNPSLTATTSSEDPTAFSAISCVSSTPTSTKTTTPKPKIAKIARFEVDQQDVNISATWCREEIKTLYAELSGLIRNIKFRYPTRAQTSRASQNVPGLETVSEGKMKLLFEMVKGAMEPVEDEADEEGSESE